VQRYDVEQIGSTVAWTGLSQLLLTPFMPTLMKRFEVRLIGGAGISLFAASSFMDITLSFDTVGDHSS
jgi:DHA2 family multidrug resistance protein